MTKNTISRIVGAIAAIVITISIFVIDPQKNIITEIQDVWFWIIAAISTLLALIFTPYVTVVPYIWVRNKIHAAAASDLIAAAIGLTLGLLISALLAIPLQCLPFNIGR